MKIRQGLLSVVCSIMMMGCTTVQPWERGTLAKPHMAMDPHPLHSALRKHNYISREGASGGDSTGGGGCGCY